MLCGLCSQPGETPHSSLVGRVEADTWENLASGEGLSASAPAGMWASSAGCVSLRVGEGSNLRGGPTPGSSLQPRVPKWRAPGTRRLQQ